MPSRVICMHKQTKHSNTIDRGEPGGLGPQRQWEKISTSVLAVQNGQIYTESLTFSNCECECD